jgi:ComF family protein
VNTPRAAVNLNGSPEVDSFWRRIQWALLPPQCLLCRQRSDRSSDLCAACVGDLARNRHACARCAVPLPVAAAMCGACLKNQPPFDAAIAPFLYAHPLDLLLTRLKFGRSLAAGRVLAQIWTAALREALADSTIGALPDVLVPVPLHADRLRERGYNQALELSKVLAREFSIPLAAQMLTRTRATPAQANLDAKTRRTNLRGAFEYAENRDAGIDPKAQPHAVRSAVQSDRSLYSSRPPDHVAIIDDVMTTGATLRECARTLKRAGVGRVDVWALARAPRGR